jgi:formylglycine-generating enzyme required for sulfatase activity
MHTVRLTKPFYLDKYEVTQGQWEAVMGNNPSYFKGDAALPVERVSWKDAQEFISRLNAHERGTAFYRLPTEAEWEYTARAGATTAYGFGDSASDLGCSIPGSVKTRVKKLSGGTTAAACLGTL